MQYSLFSSTAVDEPIASTHCAYRQRDGSRHKNQPRKRKDTIFLTDIVTARRIQQNMSAGFAGLTLVWQSPKNKATQKCSFAN